MKKCSLKNPFVYGEHILLKLTFSLLGPVNAENRFVHVKGASDFITNSQGGLCYLCHNNCQKRKLFVEMQYFLGVWTTKCQTNIQNAPLSFSIINLQTPFSKRFWSAMSWTQAHQNYSNFQQYPTTNSYLITQSGFLCCGWINANPCILKISQLTQRWWGFIGKASLSLVSWQGEKNF